MSKLDSRNTFHVSRSINPIIIKEMRGHMRGSRAFWILTGYLLGLGLLVYGLYRVTLTSASNRFGPGAPPQSAFIGQSLFTGLIFLELVFVCFITPALTAGVISGETERRTYDMLLATPLRPASILWGKMFSSLTYVQLLILAAIPLSSVVFLFGGVALRDLVQAIGLLALTAITYGTLGLFFSALTRRTSRAMVWSYVVVLALMFGTLFIWAVTGAVSQRVPPREILYPNPISAMASAIVPAGPTGRFYGGMGSAVDLLLLLGGGSEVLGTSSAQPLARPLWQYTVALYLAATVLLYLLTTQLVKPVRRWRVGWWGLIGLLLVVALLVAGLAFVFGTDKGSTGWRGDAAPTPAPVFFGPGPVREVIVERVVEVPALPPPPPPPTPTEAPPLTPTPASLPPLPFDANEHVAAMRDCLEHDLWPAGEAVFCDLAILGDNFESGFLHAEAYTWAHCRAFRTSDGKLISGLGIGAPAFVNLSWAPDLDWQVNDCWFGDMRAFSPEIQQRLLESPYDEMAGEERLQERARQALLGE